MTDVRHPSTAAQHGIGNAVLHLRRRAAPPLPGNAFARGNDFPFMVEKEWTHDAAWSLDAAGYAAFAGMAEDLYALAVRCADAALAEATALDRLGLTEVTEVLRVSRARAPLFTRMDFALERVGPDQWRPHLLELNGDTAGNLLEGGLLQAEWGRAVGARTAGDTLEAAVAEALRALPGPLTILHHPDDPYIVSHARWFASLVPGAVRSEYPTVPTADGAVYKMFRWGRLWAGRFPEVGAFARAAPERVWEPPWSVLLQHKGLLAAMWDVGAGMPGLLPSTLDGPAALPDPSRGWAEKSFHGVSGYEVRVLAGDTPLHAPLPGHVYQERVPMETVDGLWPILCACLVGGRFAGAVMREDDTAISTDDIVAPIQIT